MKPFVWLMAGIAVACTSSSTTTAPTNTAPAGSETTVSTTIPVTLTTLIVSGPTTPPTTPGTTSDFVVPFQIEVPNSITIVHTVNDGWVTFQRGSTENLLFTTAGPTDPEAWARFLSGQDGLTLTEGASEVGGVAAQVFDLELTGEPVSIATYNPTPEELTGWVISADNDQRIYVLEVAEVTIAIVAEAPDAVFGDWLQVVEESLGSLTWSSSN